MLNPGWAKKAQELDERRQQQIARQVDAINRLLEERTVLVDRIKELEAREEQTPRIRELEAREERLRRAEDQINRAARRIKELEAREKSSLED